MKGQIHLMHSDIHVIALTIGQLTRIPTFIWLIKTPLSAAIILRLPSYWATLGWWRGCNYTINFLSVVMISTVQSVFMWKIKYLYVLVWYSDNSDNRWRCYRVIVFPNSKYQSYQIKVYIYELNRYCLYFNIF